MQSARVPWAMEMIRTWNQGEVDSFLDSLDPEFEFTPDPAFPDSDTLRGEKLRQWLRDWIQTWEGNRLEVVEIEEREEGVLARCRWHLRASEGGLEVPADDFTFVIFYDEQDRPRRLLAFFDRADAETALQRFG